jgi:gliding motility-associated-like protein
LPLPVVLKKLISISLFVLIARLAFAQLGTVTLQCASVQLSGNPVIQWSQIADPLGQFVSYDIFNASSAGGIYILVASIPDIGITSFQHINANPLTSDECYYVQVISSDGITTFTSPASNTVCTISLDVQPSITPAGQVLLNWTNPYPSGAPVGTGDYEIWQEFPAGTWVQVATLPLGTQTWSFEVMQCEVTYNFQIMLDATSGCSHESDIAGGTFFDVTPPDIPEVTSVWIDHVTNDAVVEWNPSEADDTQGYILYRCSGATVTLLDTIWGPQSDTFTDLLAPTTNGSVCYLLAAFDTCYTGIPPSPNTSPTSDVCNCSVYLSQISYAICSESVNLSWTPYTGWSAGVSEYEIYFSIDGGLPELAGVVAGDETTFTHNFGNPVPGAYGYYIIAFSADGYEAQSNLRNVNITYPIAPPVNYLSSASVTDAKQVTVTVQTPPNTTEHFFHLDRRIYDDTDWQEIDVQSNLLGNEVVFTDTDVLPSTFNYNYRVRVRNQCNDWVDTTAISRTMVLQGLANTDRLVNVLQWSHYSGWENGVLAYRVHREDPETGTTEVVVEVNGTQTYYEDDVSDLIYTSGRFCYHIEAVERPSSLFPSVSFTALSNVICLIQQPVIWVPNAFVVDGFNTTFQPVISFADFDHYKMLIYSRWGDVIYETEDINAPWDGRMNGEMVQEGVYAYYISVEDGNGRPYEARGTVLMLSNRDQ